ncbi:hypothetical protein NC652_030391 [Populus alba x Populus x berolinensis]|nr:hypothetical protein NC652_030391 [Populus alba x Populus x berolinensis]
MNQNEAKIWTKRKTKNPPKESPTLQTLTDTQLSSSVSKPLRLFSPRFHRTKDFHFYYYFDVFKIRIQENRQGSRNRYSNQAGLPRSIIIFSKTSYCFPTDVDIGRGVYDWLVNVNDEIFEREEGIRSQLKKTVSDDSVSRAGGDSGVKVAGIT